MKHDVIERGRSGEEESWQRVGFPNGRVKPLNNRSTGFGPGSPLHIEVLLSSEVKK